MIIIFINQWPGVPRVLFHCKSDLLCKQRQLYPLEIAEYLICKNFKLNNNMFVENYQGRVRPLEAKLLSTDRRQKLCSLVEESSLEF